MEPLAVRPKELPRLTGLSRALCYRLLKEGRIPSVRVGRAVLVPIDRLRQWVDQQGDSGDR